MPNVSIRARLILLSVLLLAILAVSSALLIRELARDSQSLATEATLVSTVKNANSASKHFGDLKYWVVDAAVTQLASSQQKAAGAKARLDSDLKALSTVEPALVAPIGTRSRYNDRPGAQGRRSPTRPTTARPAMPCWRRPRATSPQSMTGSTRSWTRSSSGPLPGGTPRRARRSARSGSRSSAGLSRSRSRSPSRRSPCARSPSPWGGWSEASLRLPRANSMSQCRRPGCARSRR